MPLTLSEAKSFSNKGLEKAKQMNLRVSIVVVDEMGVVQLDRMDGASLMSPDVAEAKATTALNFRRPTSALAQDAQSNAERFRTLQQAVHFNVTPIGGGVPVLQDGVAIAAVGVSGGTAEQDEEIARAAIS